MTEYLYDKEFAAYIRGGFDVSSNDLGADDPFSITQVEYDTFVKSSLTLAQVAEMMGVEQDKVRHALESRSLYGIQVSQDWLVPSFQFEENQPLPGLEQVIREIDPTLHPLGVHHWFTTPNVDLLIDDEEVSPRDWLYNKLDAESVSELARDL